jgi:hypothetical protein
MEFKKITALLAREAKKKMVALAPLSFFSINKNLQRTKPLDNSYTI